MNVAAYAIIFVGCGYLGILFSLSFKKRVTQLEDFRHIVKQLEFDIDFLNTPLCDSLKRLSNLCDGGIGDVITYVYKGLSVGGCVEMKRLWKDAVERFEYELALNDEDKKIIIEFAGSLGCGDRIREKNNIKATAMRLDVAIDEARGLAVTNSRMYRGLGFLTGIFIIIVML